MELTENHERIKQLMSQQNSITSILELKDVQITNIESLSQENYIHIEIPKKLHHCPNCKHLTDTIHDYRIQIILDVPLYSKKTYLVYRKRRYRCPGCGKRFFEKNSFLPRYSHTTNRLYLRLFQELHSVSSQKTIAQHYFTSTMRVRRVLDAIKPPLPQLPEVLGMDEFKGNSNKTKYHCILTDLSKHKPIDILANRTEATLINHFKKYQYTDQLKNVKVIVIDMWRSYYCVLRKIFPNAVILIDRFHMVRQVMWSLENVRKRVQKEMPKSLRIYFKHSRKVLLKHASKLIVNDHINEYLIRDRLLRYLPNLKTAYLLKEELLDLVHATHTFDSAHSCLNDWIQKAKASEIPEFHSCIRAYQNWKGPILNSFTSSYSNGFTEGCNNKIKVIKRNAFGFKNFDRFRTRILINFV